MSSSRVHLRFVAGVLCSSTQCLDSVDEPLPCAPKVKFESCPVWKGHRDSMVLRSAAVTTKYLLREHVLNTKKTDHTICFIQYNRLTKLPYSALRLEASRQ